ncbi:MAG TPA: hypothetical protein VJR46_11130 [Candidatus Dormibacteraeota bacterium]|nr:hypothetical protein [Candidatus Dormibacteraeota bacterium]
MKQRRPERVERRRALAEVNLIAEGRKAKAPRRGCLPLTILVMTFWPCLMVALGLHTA